MANLRKILEHKRKEKIRKVALEVVKVKKFESWERNIADKYAIITGLTN